MGTDGRVNAPEAEIEVMFGDSQGEDEPDLYDDLAGNGEREGRVEEFLRRRAPDFMDGVGEGQRSLERRRRSLRRQLAGARVDIEKNLEGSEMPAEDVEAVLQEVDAIVDILESDPDARDYLEAVRRSRDAIDYLSSPPGYLGASLALSGLLLRFRVTAQIAAVPVAAYLLYLLFRNVETIRTAFHEGRHVVAVRVPDDSVPPGVERIPFEDVRHVDAIDRAVGKAVRADDGAEWISRAIDLGGAKDMDEVQRALAAHDRAPDGSYYVQHERAVVSVEVFGEEDEEVEIEIA